MTIKKRSESESNGKKITIYSVTSEEGEVFFSEIQGKEDNVYLFVRRVNEETQVIATCVGIAEFTQIMYGLLKNSIRKSLSISKQEE